MATLIKDSYVFGGVKLQAQYENAGPQAPDRPVSNTSLDFEKENGWWVCRNVGRIAGISILELWIKDSSSSTTQIKIKANGTRSGTKFRLNADFGDLAVNEDFTYTLLNGMGTTISHHNNFTVNDLVPMVAALRDHGTLIATVS